MPSGYDSGRLVSTREMAICHYLENERCQEQFPRSNEGRPRNTRTGKLFQTPFRSPLRDGG